MTELPGPLELAAMLYRLQFPTKDFWTLPESVQVAYRRDALRLRDMMAQAAAVP